MKEINETWYTITNWDKTTYETQVKSDAQLAIREECEVIKTTRKVFKSGLSNVYLTVTTEIKKIKDL